jgi:hypothetical protein
MIEEESKAALERIRNMNGNKDSLEFSEYSDNFMRNLKNDLSMSVLNTKKLIDYIKELDEREK